MMKKLIASLMIAVALTTIAPSAKAADAGGAAIISAVMPGCGEWYNRGWSGGFPWGECIVGHICCLFQLSSVMDAVNGNTDNDMRFDFWSAPKR